MKVKMKIYLEERLGKNDLTISSKKSPTSISGRWIAFFLFFIRYYGILKMIKDKNKGVDIMKTKIIKISYKFRIYPRYYIVKQLLDITQIYIV